MGSVSNCAFIGLNFDCVVSLTSGLMWALSIWNESAIMHAISYFVNESNAEQWKIPFISGSPFFFYKLFLIIYSKIKLENFN